MWKRWVLSVLTFLKNATCNSLVLGSLGKVAVSQDGLGTRWADIMGHDVSVVFSMNPPFESIKTRQAATQGSMMSSAPPSSQSVGGCLCFWNCLPHLKMPCSRQSHWRFSSNLGSQMQLARSWGHGFESLGGEELGHGRKGPRLTTERFEKEYVKIGGLKFNEPGEFSGKFGWGGACLTSHDFCWAWWKVEIDGRMYS